MRYRFGQRSQFGADRIGTVRWIWVLGQWNRRAAVARALTVVVELSGYGCSGTEYGDTDSDHAIRHAWPCPARAVSDWVLAVPIGIGVASGVLIGAVIAHRISAVAMQRAVAIALLSSGAIIVSRFIV